MSTPETNPKITAIGFDLFGVTVDHYYQKGDPHILDMVKKLRGRGYMVGMLSNVDANYEFLHRYHSILGHFDRVLLSSEIGVAKPNPQAFQRLVSQLGSPPEATVFIDDILENVESAKSIGIHGILYQTPPALLTELRRLGVNI